MPVVLDILTYNIFLRSPGLFFRDRQRERVRAMPPVLPQCDVVVFQEAFDHRLRRSLVAQLAAEYPYRTSVLQPSSLFTRNGGVLIVSQWPIEHEDQVAFGWVAAGTDRLVSKGVVHARIRKAGLAVHVFGVHCQNGVTRRDAKVRARQLAMVRAFVASHAIPRTEPVIIAGDFNIDALTDAGQGEYTHMTRVLDAMPPSPVPGPSREPTYDCRTNPLTRERLTACVDHVLYSNAHRAPIRSFTDVQALRAGGQDLSDHSAVHARLEFAD